MRVWFSIHHALVICVGKVPIDEMGSRDLLMGKEKKKAMTSAQGNEDYLADVPSRVVSGSMGLVAFALAAGVGLWAGNSALVILTRALVACALCAIIGRVLGAMGEACIGDFIGKYRGDNPKPVMPEELRQLESDRAAHGQVVDEMRKKAA